MDQTEESGLRSTLRIASEQLKLELKNARGTFDHNGVKGTRVEEAFRNFLQRHLPDSIGITSGEIVDIHGGRSGQIDLILYDKIRTPMLFGDKNSTDHSVPAEGAIAAVEVKSHLKKAMLTDLIRSCRRVKRLRKEAYFDTPITFRYSRYGREYSDPPIYYTVFGFESDSAYAEPLNEMQRDMPAEERIDSLCYLGRGVSLNTSLDWPGPDLSFSPWPRPDSFLTDTSDHDRALLLWFSLFSSAVTQATTRPIDLSRYLAADLKEIETSLPAGATSRRLTEEAAKGMAEDMGIRPEILLKKSRGEGLTFAEAVEVLTVNEDYICETDDMSDQSRQMLQLAKEHVRQSRRD